MVAGSTLHSSGTSVLYDVAAAVCGFSGLRGFETYGHFAALLPP